MIKKRRQHYVWRHYLRAWSDNNDHLYCSRAGKVFKSNLVNVALEKDFYRLKELSTQEIAFLERIFLDNFPKHLRDLNTDWLTLFNQVFQMRRQLEERGMLDEEWESFLDTVTNNFEEDCHSKVEEDSIKFLASVKGGNLPFLNDELEYVDFLFFLCLQYLRTKKVKHDFLSSLSKAVTDVNLEAVWGILKYILATNVSYNLYAKRNVMKLGLLKNTTSMEFISGDQPVVNTFAMGTLPSQTVDDLELYYPVSPNLAMLISSRPDFASGATIKLDETEVVMYNRHIVENSHEQLYASSPFSLERVLRTDL